jgi:hypothetical protein
MIRGARTQLHGGLEKQIDTTMKHHHRKHRNQPADELVVSINRKFFAPTQMQTLEILFSRNTRLLLLMVSDFHGDGKSL